MTDYLSIFVSIVQANDFPVRYCSIDPVYSASLCRIRILLYEDSPSVENSLWLDLLSNADINIVLWLIPNSVIHFFIHSFFFFTSSFLIRLSLLVQPISSSYPIISLRRTASLRKSIVNLCHKERYPLSLSH